MLIHQHQANERLWALAAASQPHLTKSGQKEGWNAAKRVGDVGRVRKSALEMVDTTTRIEMIGSSLKLHGKRWAARNGKHLAWLASIGVTQEEAIQRHERWMSERLSNPFWRANRGG